MGYTSKYKQAEIETILDAKNNTGAGVDATLDGLFIDALQTKVVELSESAEITPDEGYLGLKKVNVSVKGGGGNAPSEGDSYVYIDVRNAQEDVKIMLRALSSLLRTKDTIYFTASSMDVLLSFVDYLAIDEKSTSNQFGEVMTIPQLFEQNGVGDLYYSLPRITKEEFYAL